MRRPATVALAASVVTATAQNSPVMIRAPDHHGSALTVDREGGA
jgi:hypothetical protein